jgi:penicillin-binding protein 2
MDIFGNFAELKGDSEKRKVSLPEELDFSYSEIALNKIGEMSEKAPQKRPILLKVLLIGLFSVLILRLFLFQVTNGEENQKLAEGNRVRPRILEADRGIITDNNGNFLARNKPSYALAIYPSDLPKKKAERFKVYQRLADICNLPIEEIQKTAEKNGLTSLDEVDLLENLDHDQSLLLEEQTAGIPGVFIAKKPVREYALLPGIAHLLGYTGMVSPEDLKEGSDYYSSDKIGKTGIEYQYEKYLKGIHGVEQIEVDSKGSIVKILVDNENRKPISGNEVVLNIDSLLQQKTAEALRSGIEDGKKTTGQEVSGGVAMVMNVQTGAMLSMVSFPDYDNNLFSGKIKNDEYQKLLADKNLPMFNRATQGVYPPGSVSKIIMAAAGLMEGNITKSTSMVTPPAIEIGEYVFPDWKDHSYVSTDVERAIAESNNIFFYALGGGFEKIKGLGIDKMKSWWQKFGLGEKTGIDLTGEASGFLPDAEWKKRVKKEDWYLGDTYHAAIGQGDLLVTPIQMLRATAAVANGGKLLKPQLVKKVVGADGRVVAEFGPKVVRQDFLSAEAIKTIQQGMRQTITEGSARSLNDLSVSVAGKTGTAQFSNNQKTHAWFECYAPYESPEIAILVMVDGGGGGHEIAAPVAKQILQYYFAQ